MADGDDLPDTDYESIYGHEALRARTLARLTAIEQSIARLLVQTQRWRLPDAASRQGSPEERR